MNPDHAQGCSRLFSHIRRATEARRAVERNNRDDLIEYLYQHYSEDDKKSAVMDTVFDKFLVYKRDVLSRSQETVERIRYTYRRFMTEEIRQRKMSSITETELMRYVRSIVDTEHPKERTLKSFLQMIHGLFRFGYDNHYTSSDVSKRIVAENFYKDCDCSKKEAGEKIFSPAEIHLIQETMPEKARLLVFNYTQELFSAQRPANPLTPISTDKLLSDLEESRRQIEAGEGTNTKEALKEMGKQHGFI